MRLHSALGSASNLNLDNALSAAADLDAELLHDAFGAGGDVAEGSAD